MFTSYGRSFVWTVETVPDTKTDSYVGVRSYYVVANIIAGLNRDF